MNLLRRIQFWVSVRVFGEAPISMHLEWTRHDEAALHEFLNNPTGKKLRKLLKSDEAGMCYLACRVHPELREHASGIAEGLGRAYAAIMVRAKKQPENEGNQILLDGEGETDASDDFMQQIIKEGARAPVLGD